MIYLDANVFVLANLNTESLGDNARSLLKGVQDGKLEAASSALSFDELVWAVKKNRTSQDSVMAGEAFLNMPRLKLVAVNGNLLASTLAIMRKYRLDPRDSIHTASALAEGAETIVSEDTHFDRVEEIKRKGVSRSL
ncbi:MAG: type II toxin-antitoxin system VapC family toxin [Nitrososphaerales archaeon]